MKVRVKLFAAARDLAAGQDSVDVVVPAGAKVADLRAALAAQVPPLAGLMRHVMFAIGREYADDRAALDETSEVACIPPVSGG